jgi:hypothetical protein
LPEQETGMLRAVGLFFKRLGWTVLWAVENVYLNLLGLGSRRPAASGLDPLITDNPSPEAVREALRLEERRQALRLSDIWGRSQRVEHEIAERQRQRGS